MKEAKIIDGERRENMEEIKKEKSLKEKVDEMHNTLYDPKTKKIKIPRKAKVRKGKVKKGWVGVLTIDTNGNISGEKQKLAEFVIRTKDGLYHTTDGREILFWQGKFPIVIQPSWRNNPLNIRNDVEKNETYGQPHIMARMLNDTIRIKKPGGSFIIWILVIGAVLFGINYFLNGGGI